MRLRYARTLFEETDNDLEAETALSKGVCFSLKLSLHWITQLTSNRLIFANELVLVLSHLGRFLPMTDSV